MEPLKLSRMRLVLFASSLGSMMDWYDFLIYGSLASVLAVNFFPSQNPYIGIMSTLAVMGVGYVARPVGGLVFGRMGDRIGRKTTFIVTMMVVGFSTALMGLLPTYQSVGIVAPALLVALRLIQGMGFGGEYAGAGTYIAEFSADNRRATYTALGLHMTGPLATLMGTAVILVIINSLGNAAMISYGWRIAFLVSLVLLVLGAFMRVKLTETPLFQGIKKAGKLSKDPVREGLRSGWRKLVFYIVAFQSGGQIIAYSAGLTGPIIFMTTIMKPPISLAVASQLTIIGNLIALPFYPLFGYLSDRIRSRKKVFYGFMVASAIMLFPLYYLINIGGSTGNMGLMVTAMIIMTLLYTPIAAVTSAFWTELFPTRVRYTSFAVGNALSVAIFGGFTPFVVSAIVNAAGGQFFVGLLWPIAYSLFCAAIGIRYVKETHAKLPE